MMTDNKTATILRDEDENMIVDTDGQITCVCDDGLTFKISLDLIDFECNTLRCNVDGTEIDVALDQSNPPQMYLHTQNTNDNSGEIDTANATFAWTDASTKLLLSLYKDKINLIAARKIKTHKLMWKQISEKMLELNYKVSPIQVKNKFKTMERAFKNMVSTNKKTGRGRATCSYYSELTELLGKKHNIAPLAVSGRAGLIIRENAAASDDTQCVSHDNSTMDTPPSHVPTTSTDICPDPESSSSTSTSSGPELMFLNNNGQRRYTNTGSTARSLAQCKAAIDLLTKEIREQRTNREQVQLEILNEQKIIVKLHEEFIEAAKEQRALANQQREEKNQLLRQVLELLQSQKNEK